MPGNIKQNVFDPTITFKFQKPEIALAAINLIDSVIEITSDVDVVLDQLMDAVRDIFQSSRAWLFHPCNPELPSFDVAFESTTPEYPGANALKQQVPMTDDMADYCRRALSVVDGPEIDPPEGLPVTNDIAIRFNVKSMLFMALWPKSGEPWMFGLHQCDSDRIWTDDEKQLFHMIGKRISACLDTLLYVGQLRDSEEKHRRLFETMAQGVVYQAADGTIISANPASERILGLSFEQMRGKMSVSPRWKMIKEDGTEVPGKDHPAMIALRTGQTVGPVIRGVFHPDRNTYIWLSITVIPIFQQGEKEPFQIYSTFEDVTERKEAEKALRESEEKYRRIYENSVVGFFQSTPEGRFLGVNPAFAKMLGYESPEELVSSVSDIASQTYANPEDRSRYHKALEADGYAEDFELKARCRDGSEIWVSDSSRAEFDEDGKIVRYEGIVVDITDRKQAEEELYKIEAMTKALLNGIPESAFLIEFDGTIIAANTTVAQRLNCPMEELIASNIYNRVSHEVSEFRRKFIDQAVQTGKPFQFEDVRSGRNIDNRINPILDQHGKVTRLAIVGIDITEQKRTEEALRESEDFLNRTGDMAQVGGWEVDLDTMKVVWTKTTGRIHELPHGYFPDLEEAISYYHPEDQDHVRQCVQRAIESSEPFDFTVRLITAKGRERWVRALGQPIFDSGSCVRLSGTFQDITERLKLEEELRQSQKMESIGTLAGGIAHDFNNILGIIVGNTELAMFDIPKWSPAQESLKEVREASLRARDLVTQILLFARQKEHTLSNIRVEPIAMESLKMLRATIPTTVEINQEIQEDLPTVLADAAQIQQIIMNLCTNAGQVMEADGGTLRFKLDLAELNAPTDTLAGRITEGRYVRIQVQDTGPGISPENLERIFEPFFTTKGVGEGTGLGLAVVHGIVQDRHGGILVESEEGKGTIFRVYLPASEEAPADESQEEESELPKGHERVLFVDDEPMIMKLGQRMLERQGYHVETRASGTDALECFRQDPHRFDLVVTDMTMPGMRGDRLAEEILAIRPGIPVILSTGYSKHISNEKAREMGIRAFVMKPLTAQELASTVRKVLNEKSRK